MHILGKPPCWGKTSVCDFALGRSHKIESGSRAFLVRCERRAVPFDRAAHTTARRLSALRDRQAGIALRRLSALHALAGATS